LNPNITLVELLNLNTKFHLHVPVCMYRHIFSFGCRAFCQVGRTMGIRFFYCRSIVRLNSLRSN